jgi:uncharacterized protein (DUF1697 family)
VLRLSIATFVVIEIVAIVVVAIRSPRDAKAPFDERETLEVTGTPITNTIRKLRFERNEMTQQISPTASASRVRPSTRSSSARRAGQSGRSLHTLPWRASCAPRNVVSFVSSRGSEMTVYVSMLRAVNVGGTSRIKMEALRAVYESLGFGDVRTLLQSGNVLFRSNLTDRRALVKRITQELERHLRLKVVVILRTLAEVATIVERGPVLSPRADNRKLLVMFLSDVPGAAAQAALTKWHKSKEMNEMIELRGPEIYLYYPDGVGRSKLTSAVIEGKLDTAGTARNWNTLVKLVEAGRALERAGARG